ncbi:hypothetical protein B0H13DRAFT_1866678 [Mycena leptocephala]|nr:hypothetical protein B0H13DRAFT_1866678 [Mycena leptocephala]
MLTGIFQPLLLVLLAVAAAAAPTNNDGIIGLAYDIAPACEDCGVVAESDGTAVGYDIVPACDDCGVVADSDGTAVAVAPTEVTPAPTPTTLNIGERQCFLCGIQSSA